MRRSSQIAHKKSLPRGNDKRCRFESTDYHLQCLYPAVMPPPNFSDIEQQAHDPSHTSTGPSEKQKQQKDDNEQHVQRNPHPDFKNVEASRPDWSSEAQLHFTKTRQPDWKIGQGAGDGGESLEKKHIDIDPYEDGRPAIFNYKLLISGIIPRPIGFVSTRSEDGKSCPSLFLLQSPFSPLSL